jgi:hypothetical protein
MQGLYLVGIFSKLRDLDQGRFVLETQLFDSRGLGAIGLIE